MNQPALLTENSGALSYGELLHHAETLGRQIPSRQLVFNLCSSSIASIAAYLGFMKTGSVQLLLNDRIDSEALHRLLSNYRPAYVFLSKDKAPLLNSGQEVFTFADHVLVKTHFHSDYVLHDELRLLLTTSGSTGSPKLVRLSEKNLVSNADAIADSLQIDGNERPITTLSMSYAYGLSILNSHLQRGASLALSNASLAESGFWSLLKHSKATSFGGVPYTYEMLKRLRFEKMELPSLRTMTQAGGKLSKELTAEFVALSQRRGMRFFVMYGQTEATARMSCLPWEKAEEKCGSIGIAIPGGEFSLLNEDGQTIQDSGIPGELLYRGPNVSMGYAETPEDLNLGDLNQGLLRTGDLAYRDDDGFYFITGRKHRFLKVFGNRVNLHEVEELVREAGFEAACAGRDDRIDIYLTDKSAAGVLPAQLNHRTGLHPSAFRLVFIPHIPRNETGKVLYAELEKMAEVPRG